MLTLCLDCSVKNVTLALIEAEKILATVNRATPGSQAQEMIGCIDELLVAAKKPLPEITDVLFCHGPGSFTSLRVGLATLLGLFGGTRVNLKVASSLLLRCLSASEKNGVRVAVIKMGRDRFALGVLRGAEFSEKIYAVAALEKEFLTLGVSLNPEGDDHVSAEANLYLLNSSFVQKATWDEAWLHYLLDPDIG